MGKPLSPAEQALRDAAIEFHRAPTHGKISIAPTKPLFNQRDLSLAYSPGVVSSIFFWSSRYPDS